MFNKDFGKRASDLLNDDFPESLEIEVESKCEAHNCFNVTGETCVDPADGTIAGKIKPTIKLDDRHTLELELGTDGRYIAKLVGKNFIKNLKTSLTTECQSTVTEGQVNHAQKISLAADYSADNITASMKVFFPKLAFTPKTTLGGVFVRDNIAIGAEAVTSFNSGVELEKVTGNFQVAKDEAILSLSGSLAGGNISGALKYHCNLSTSVFGAKVEWCGKEQEASAAIAFGRELRQNGFGKFSLNTNGDFGVSYRQSLCEKTSVVVATTVNSADLIHKTGVAFEFAI